MKLNKILEAKMKERREVLAKGGVNDDAIKKQNGVKLPMSRPQEEPTCDSLDDSFGGTSKF